MEKENHSKAMHNLPVLNMVAVYTTKLDTCSESIYSLSIHCHTLDLSQFLALVCKTTTNEWNPVELLL